MILTALDAQGYPVSFRCKPQVDTEQQVIRIEAPPGGDLQEGAANLLGHFHDDDLWNQHSVLIKGKLEKSGGGWVLHPQTVTPGLEQGVFSAIKALSASRAAAARFLAKRNRPRPVIPWKTLDALKPKR
jgi:hypothetical protein